LRPVPKTASFSGKRIRPIERQTCEAERQALNGFACKGINTNWISLPFPGNRANRDDSPTFVGAVWGHTLGFEVWGFGVRGSLLNERLASPGNWMSFSLDTQYDWNHFGLRIVFL
jgi:hypothetical protein